MKIKSIDLTRLQNAEHFQFCIEMNELIVKYTPTAIDIQTLYPAFEQAMADEDQSFKIVQKSALSKDIEQADKKTRYHLCRTSGAGKSAGKAF